MNINKLYKNYKDQLNENLDLVNKKDLELISKKLISIFKKKKNIYICGNGGSAAISNHYICDYLKLIRYNTNFKPKIYSLNDNIENITAISNDIKYEEIFKYQAETYMEKDDLLIIISSSGNSKNVIKLAKWAKNKKIFVISFTGFNGGRLKKLSSINININDSNYGRIEDCHHILMHLIMHNIILNNAKIKKVRI